jgi:oligopeptide transport system ATP-binding protein
VEYGTVEDVFYHSRHPYTWSLLSSLPQLGTKGHELYSIPGTPPSLYKTIVGDAFAPRNPYAMQVDFEVDPPKFPVPGSDTHWAKTWLLDPRAPEKEMPELIRDLHESIKSILKFEVNLAEENMTPGEEQEDEAEANIPVEGGNSVDA